MSYHYANSKLLIIAINSIIQKMDESELSAKGIKMTMLI